VNATSTADTVGVRERAGPLEHLTTAAGQVDFVQVKGTKTLSLAGKPIGGEAAGNINIERAFDFPDKKTALLLSVSDGGAACPSMYYFVTIRPDGSTTSTDSFGTCSDVPKVTLANEGITVNLPDMQGRGDEAWLYAHEGLSKTKSIDPNIERNAKPLRFTEGEPTQMRGTLIHDQGTPPNWSLKLPAVTKLDVGSSGGCRPSVVESLALSLPSGSVPPAADGERTFVATISCPESGPTITSLQLPSAGLPAPTAPASAVVIAQRTSVRYVAAGATVCFTLQAAIQYGPIRQYESEFPMRPKGGLPEGCKSATRDLVIGQLVRVDGDRRRAVVRGAEGPVAVVIYENDVSYR
jgi:hypothetical protein